MYRRTPTGEYLVGVCTNTLCAIMGGDAILESLEDHLGIHAGQTTDDGRVTLEHVECNAACDYAPVVMVNWEFFDNQTPSSARDLVDALRAGQPVVPTRGAPVCTFSEPPAPWPACRIIPRRRESARSDNPDPTGAATLAGLRVAQERDMTAPEPAPARTHASTNRRAPSRRRSNPPRTNPRRHRRPPCHPSPAGPKPTRAQRIRTQ